MRNPVLFLLALLFMGCTVLIAQQPPAQELQGVGVIHREPPVYPKEAKGIGAVILEGVVDMNGNLRSARVIEGDNIFADAALAAVKRWKFQPAMLSGRPIEQTIRIRMNVCPKDVCR